MTATEFRQLPECLLCQYYHCDLHLRCAVHPSGVERESCPDYRSIAPDEQTRAASRTSVDWKNPKK